MIKINIYRVRDRDRVTTVRVIIIVFTFLCDICYFVVLMLFINYLFVC